MAIIYAEAHLLGSGRPKTASPALVRVQTCRHGSMLYFPHDVFIGGSLEKYGEYNKDETDFLLQVIPLGGVVVEVGANIGCHTVPIAQKVGPTGHVLAFEPQRIIYQMLCGNLSINALWNVSAERVALGDKEGVVFTPPMNYAEKGNFGGVSINEEGGDPVPMMKLDMYPLPALHLLKIDVEGMESQVLKGATATIMAFRPLIYIENDRPEKSAELVSLLRGMKYDLYWHLPPLFSPDNYRENKENVFENIASFNMACIPQERSEQVKTDLQRVQ